MGVAYFTLCRVGFGVEHRKKRLHVEEPSKLPKLARHPLQIGPVSAHLIRAKKIYAMAACQVLL
jgi:hypothetical protein